MKILDVFLMFTALKEDVMSDLFGSIIVEVSNIVGSDV